MEIFTIHLFRGTPLRGAGQLLAAAVLVQIDLLEPALDLPTTVAAARLSSIEILHGFQKPGVQSQKPQLPSSDGDFQNWGIAFVAGWFSSGKIPSFEMDDD